MLNKMERFLKTPNLPLGSVRAAVIGKDYAALLVPKLKALGIRPIVCPVNSFVDNRLGSHVDLSVFHLGGNRFVIAKAVSQGDFVAELRTTGAEIIVSKEQQSQLYPHDASLCALAAGNIVFHNLKCTDALIRASNVFSGFVHVNQGYAKCAVCLVDEKSAITSDKGIGNAMKSQGFEVLQISPDGIELSGFRSGFIGGSAFKTAPGKLAFTGTLDNLPDKARIEQFLFSHKVTPIYLSDKPLFDIGSVILISEECL